MSSVLSARSANTLLSDTPSVSRPHSNPMAIDPHEMPRRAPHQVPADPHVSDAMTSRNRDRQRQRRQMACARQRRWWKTESPPFSGCRASGHRRHHDAHAKNPREFPSHDHLA